jgi:hypothetical protein
MRGLIPVPISVSFLFTFLLTTITTTAAAPTFHAQVEALRAKGMSEVVPRSPIPRFLSQLPTTRSIFISTLQLTSDAYLFIYQMKN